MKAAAGKTLKDNSEKITRSLLYSTLDGNTASAKLLFALAEGQIDCEDEAVMHSLCSYAEKLALEPEWSGEGNEAGMECASEKVNRKVDLPANLASNRDKQM